MNLKILKIVGIPDNNNVTVIHNDGLFKQFALFFDGNSSFLEEIVIPNTEIVSLHLGGIQQLQNIKLPFKPDVVINNISDPEIQTHSLTLLDNMNLFDVIPLINSTNSIRKTKRDELSQTLPKNEDFIIPKTYRILPLSKENVINEAQKVFYGKPFLFRPVDSHQGEGLILIENYESANFNKYAFDGREYFITEFINFCSSNGLYQKARFFVIDGKVYPRHLISSKNWLVNSNSRQEFINNKEIIDNEESFLSSPPNIFIELCNHIYSHLKLDFFGVDCAILPNNKVVLFETNVSMRPYGQHSEYFLKIAQKNIKDALINLIIKKAKNV